MFNTGNVISTNNMTTPSGNAAANQFLIVTENGRLFQSYQTKIAFIANDGQVTMNEVYDHSKTTGKYRNMFLGEDKKATDKAVKSGEYKVANLNY